MSELLDLTGKRYGRLLVTGPNENRKGRTYWYCLCDCGKTVAVVSGNLRKRGRSTASCGCLQSEVTTARNLIHGERRRGRPTAEYSVWLDIRKRCTDPGYKQWESYGGRGIKVCERWADSYENFLEDMGRRPSPKHQIDRVDNDGPYDQSNCRWVTRLENMNNRSDNVRLTHDGETLTISEWGRRTGLGESNIWQRLNKLGWSVERALTQPVRFRSPVGTHVGRSYKKKT